MIENAAIIPLTLENIDGYFSGDEYGFFCAGTESAIKNLYKPIAIEHGYIKDELIKILNSKGDGLSFQFEVES